MNSRQVCLRPAVVLLVAALHLLMLWGWMHGAPPAARVAPVPRVAVRLLAIAPPPAPVAEPARVPTPERPTPRRPPARTTAATSPAPALPAEVVAPMAKADTAEAAASQPAPLDTPPSPLDGDATRRAIRASAHDPGLAARAGRIGTPRPSPDERLGAAVQQGAKGDCLKGEYLGGGMGLLSLPFLAAAALRDQCRH